MFIKWSPATPRAYAALSQSHGQRRRPAIAKVRHRASCASERGMHAGITTNAAASPSAKRIAASGRRRHPYETNTSRPPANAARKSGSDRPNQPAAPRAAM